MLGQKLQDGVTVIRDYGTGVPHIEAHPAELNQVWTNIIDNAIDAMDANGTLRISTRASAEHVVIEIADTGPGCLPRYRPARSRRSTPPRTSARAPGLLP